jgi:hypothetical protein
MGLDIRLPVGLLFLAIGALLIWFGLTSGPAPYETHSLGLNINLGWGAAMAAFGALMLALAVLRWRAGEN